MLAAHLNELGLGASTQNATPPHPYPAGSRANGKAPLPDPPSSQVVTARSSEVVVLHSDSDNEEEPAPRGIRNDGTLLASDPPKPLYFICFYLMHSYFASLLY